MNKLQATEKAVNEAVADFFVNLKKYPEIKGMCYSEVFVSTEENNCVKAVVSCGIVEGKSKWIQFTK